MEPALPDLAPAAAARIAESVASARAAGTRRTYASAWRAFTTWCAREGHTAVPAHPVTVAAYLVACADTVTEAGERAFAPATLAHRLAAIAHHHRTAGHPSPTGDDLVKATMAGIRRGYATAGDRPRTPRAPLLTADIVAIVDKARANCQGWADEVVERRDTAILLLGFAGAFRRSELVALSCGDISLHRLDGLHIRLRKSKTDQEGRGVVRALPFTHSHTSCPPCAWMRWAQVVAAYDTGGRPAVIRLLRTAEPFAAHVCRGPAPAPPRVRRCCARSAATATSPPPRCRGRRCTRPSAAAPNRRATTPRSLPSSVGIRCGPGSSPRPSATARARTRSCARPGTPPPPCSRSTPANTHPCSATPSPTSDSER